MSAQIDLPAHWTEAHLSHVAAIPITNGLGEAAADGDPTWPRYIRTTDIAGLFSLHPDRRVTLPPDVAAGALVAKGDLLMTAAGATVGKAYQVQDERPACFAGYLVRFRPNRARIVPGFAARWTESRHFLDQIETGAVRSTIDNFSAGKYRSMRVPIPPIAEQHAIADFLDEQSSRIDTLIDKQNQLIGTLRERRRALILRAVTKGLDSKARLRPSGLGWAGDVPVGWSVANIRRYAAMKTGHTPSRSNPEYWTDCNIPWVTLADVWQLRDGRATYLQEDTQTRISEVGLANSAAELLPAGTVVLSRTASVGFSGIMPVPMATSQDYWNWVCGPALLPTFLLATFRAMQDEFRSLMVGSTHQTIYQPIAAAISIVVPSIHEQREIVSYLDRQTAQIDALIAKAEEFIGLVRERRAALITAAVTGQIDVRTAGRAASVGA